MATFRGQDGSVHISEGTTLVGGLDAAVPPTASNVDPVAEVMSWSVTLPREKLDISVMGDASKKYRLGMKDWSGTVGARLDAGGTLQRELIDQALADNPFAFTFIFYIDNSVATELKYFRGDGYVELSNVGAELSSIDEVEFNVIPAGDLTLGWS